MGESWVNPPKVIVINGANPWQAILNKINPDMIFPKSQGVCDDFERVKELSVIMHLCHWTQWIKENYFCARQVRVTIINEKWL